LFFPPFLFFFEETKFFLFPRTDKDSGHSGNLRVRQSNRATSTRRREALFRGNASQAAQHQACARRAKLCFVEMPRKLHNTKRVILHARASEREREREHDRACVYL
jgi:hypothetical protein